MMEILTMHRAFERAERKIDDLESNKHDMQGVVYQIAHAAFDVYEEAGCPNDFCIQSMDGFTTEVPLIFGGTNRLLWTPWKGFVPDVSYCNDGFLDACAKCEHVNYDR